MKIIEGETWAIIPARGGSKSIPVKNLALLAGRPLIEYVIEAGKASRRTRRLVCSTDHPRIAQQCEAMGVEVLQRPTTLSGDDIPIIDVLYHVLRTLGEAEGSVAEFIPLLQPTSPFILPEHIDRCLELLKGDPTADSAQTIATFPHNFHAYNQRVVVEGLVQFRFPEERARGYSKQTKAIHYMFGNLVVTRSRAILEHHTLFGERSLPSIIPSRYAMDVDRAEDLEVAEWLLETGRVILGKRAAVGFAEKRGV